MNVQPFTTPTGKKAIYYHTNWSTYGRNFQVKDIPECVTDIAYAFWNVNPDGTIVTGDSWADTDKRFTSGGVEPQDTWNDTTGMFGNFGQFKKLLDSGRKMNITLSLGGWTWSKNFSPAVSTAATRTTFVSEIINTFKKYPIFNGVSLDWEYVSNDGINYGNVGNIATAQDSDNFTLFLKQLRNAFNTNSMNNYTISMCCGAATPDKIHFNVEQTHPYLDQVQIMTYDIHSGEFGEVISGHHTNPRKSSYSKYSCEEAADYFISLGVPSTKIFIGVAFYSRGFSMTDGMGKSAAGGSPDMSWEKGIVDYKSLPLPGATEYLDPESKGAYSYDPVKRVINSYDNVESTIEKCKIVYEKNLGGILIWENSADKPIIDSRSLVATMRDNLTHGQPSNTPQPTPNPQPTPQPTPKPTPQPKPTPNVNWQSEKQYNIGTEIMYNGNVYVCSVSHISSAPCAPGVNVWKLTSQPQQQPIPQPQPIGNTWDVNITYSLNQQVIYQGHTYKCITAHTSIVTWAPSIYTGSLWFLIS